MPTIDRITLLDILTSRLGTEEAKDIAFQLGVDWDDLGGEGKRGKLRELIEHCERANLIQELLAAVALRRSDAIAPETQYVVRSSSDRTRGLLSPAPSQTIVAPRQGLRRLGVISLAAIVIILAVALLWRSSFPQPVLPLSTTVLPQSLATPVLVQAGSQRISTPTLAISTPASAPTPLPTLITAAAQTICATLPGPTAPVLTIQQSDLRQFLWERRLEFRGLPLNPDAALQQHIRDDSFVPNSDEFHIDDGGVRYSAQLAEHPTQLATDGQSGKLRVYYIRESAPGNSLFIDVDARSQTQLGEKLLRDVQCRRRLRLNPDAMLQKKMVADGFVPNSDEFSAEHDGVQYKVQLSEHLEQKAADGQSGKPRIYYAKVGDLSNVLYVSE